MHVYLKHTVTSVSSLSKSPRFEIVKVSVMLALKDWESKRHFSQIRDNKQIVTFQRSNLLEKLIWQSVNNDYTE